MTNREEIPVHEFIDKTGASDEEWQKRIAPFAHPAEIKLAEIRAFVDKTWTAEDHELLHPLLRGGSIRSQFLRILDGPS